jgi:diguanylate cyclase (GGDEF)-like protein/PAS domain S-box-containing protein
MTGLRRASQVLALVAGGPESPSMRLFKSIPAWLGRLSVSRKLILIYLLDLTAVIFISGILIHEKYLSIDFARKEIIGVTYSDSVRNLLMSAVIGADSPGSEPKPLLVQFELQRALHDEALLAQSDSAAFLASWQALAEDQTNGSALRKPLVQSARSLLTTVGNQSNLILDPDLDSYYSMSLVVLRFPELVAVLEDTSQALEHKRVAIRQGRALASTTLLILAGRLDAIRQAIAADYKQAYAAGGDDFRSGLLDTQMAVDLQISQLQVQVLLFAEQDIVLADVAEFARAKSHTLQALDQAWGSASGALQGLLKARVAGSFTKMWLHLGTALALLLAILGLVYIVARQIARPLKQLAAVADDVRQSGNYNLRASWSSQDEIGHLVTTFNSMLAQLDQDRVTHQELVASARAALAQAELLESIPIPMVVTSVPDHQVLHANEAAQPWLAGRSTDPWVKGLEPGVRVRFFQRLFDHERVDEFEVRWLGGKEPLWAVLSARRLSFQGVDAVLTTFTPINVLKLMEQRLELWAKVFEASSESIIIMDAQQRVLSVNKAYCRATSYEFYEVLGEHLGMLLGHDGSDDGDHADEALAGEISRAVGTRHEWQGEVMMRKRSGGVYPAWLMISAVRDSGRTAQVSHYIGIAIDITDRKRTEARVQFLARHDVLTELPNRAMCVETLQAALHQAQASHECLAVLFIDLDRFKGINDTLGHHVGDGLLRSVAQRLQQAVRSGDMVSRLGGDEFVVILRNIKDAEQARWQVEQRLIPLVGQLHQIEGHELKVSCSVGIAIYPTDGQDLDELMRRADAAMYEAKASGRDAARVFDPSIDWAIRERQSLEQHLRLALERQEFSLQYQPRLSASTREMVGVEALIRWQSPDLGQVSPAQFIPVAEESGLIHPIGRWVLDEACRQSATWQAQGLVDLVMSINLSAAQLADPELVQLVGAILEKHGCDASRLELEITESHLMADAAAATQRLAAIKALGLQVSIDDFGTGYSSLAYLNRFPVDKLKIDQSFVRDMLDDAANLAIVRATIALGHTLGLGIVAEGVELLAQADQLTQLGCDELQGYYFSRPLTPQALMQWLANGQQAPEQRLADATAGKPQLG